MATKKWLLGLMAVVSVFMTTDLPKDGNDCEDPKSEVTVDEE